jgi:hypothetical protein
MAKQCRKPFANKHPEKGRNYRIASRKAGCETVDWRQGFCR